MAKRDKPRKKPDSRAGSTAPLAADRQGGLVQPTDDGKNENGPQTTLKVLVFDQSVIAKVATLRGMSIKKFFMEQDVRDFFARLLTTELRLEGERIKARRLAARVEELEDEKEEMLLEKELEEDDFE
jgi:hypothetical protein